MKIRKLNMRGVAQHLALVIVVLGVAIGGTAYLVASHADTNKVPAHDNITYLCPGSGVSYQVAAGSTCTKVVGSDCPNGTVDDSPVTPHICVKLSPVAESSDHTCPGKLVYFNDSCWVYVQAPSCAVGHIVNTSCVVTSQPTLQHNYACPAYTTLDSQHMCVSTNTIHGTSNSPTAPNAPPTISCTFTPNPTHPKAGQEFTVKVKVVNSASTAQTVGFQATDLTKTGATFDIPLGNAFSVPAHGSQTVNEPWFVPVHIATVKTEITKTTGADLCTKTFSVRS